MGLYLLNISVDPVDPYPDYLSEDLSVNDQESIIEIIVEQVLGFEDALEEYDDPDSENQNTKKNVKIDLSAFIVSQKNQLQNQPIARISLHADYQDRLSSGFLEIDNPPPKV